MSRATRFATYAVLVFWSVACLFPLYWIAITSIKQPLDVISGPFYLPWIDFTPSFKEAWGYILFNPNDDTLRRYANSVVTASVATILTLLLGGWATYSLSRFRHSFSAPFLAGVLAAAGFAGMALVARTATVKVGAVVGLALVLIVALRPSRGGRRTVLGNSGVRAAILATRILPPIVTVLPIYLLAQSVGLLDTRSALVVAYTAINLPVAVWLLDDYFRDVPVEVEEAAQLDGASHFRIFFAIVLPLSRAGVAATGLVILILCWNEYLVSLYLTTDHALTMPPFLAGQMAVREQMATAEPQWAYMSVLIVLMVAPIAGFVGFVQGAMIRTGWR